MNSMSTMPPGACFRSQCALAALRLLDKGAHLEDVGARPSSRSRLRDDRGAISFAARVDQRLVAGDRPGAGQRHVLPGPGLLRLIGGEGLDMGGERPGLARGAQAEIDLVERALGGRRRERRDEALGEPGKILRAGRAAARRRRRVAFSSKS